MEPDWIDLMAVVVLAASGFVATNLDNLVLVTGLLGIHSQSRSAVLLGFLAASVAVVCLASVGVLLGDLVSPRLIGYLGLVPLGMGLHALYRQYRPQPVGESALRASSGESDPAIWISTFALMLGNSGDSLALFLPLLAESARTTLLLLALSWLIMAIFWVLLAYALSGQRALAELLERRGSFFMPWVMIGVGLYIMSDTATDTLLN